MKIEKIEDVLIWTREFHQHLSRCAQHCSDINENERAKLLLNYLSEHEKTLADIVDRFIETANINALNTWCSEYLQKNPVVYHSSCDSDFSAMGPDEIIPVIIDQHAKIIELYQYLRSRADAPSAHDLLDKLVSLEEHETMRMVQGSNRLRDI